MDGSLSSLCEIIRDGFFFVLETLYEDKNDIPNVLIKIYIEKTNESSMLFTLNQKEIIEVKKSITKSQYGNGIMSFYYQDETYANYCICYEAFSNYRIVFMANDGISPNRKFLIWQIAKYYFTRIIRFLKSFFDDRSQSYYMIDIEGEETSIITNAIVDFFSVVYGLDINFITTLSTLTYEGQKTDCCIYRPLKGISRSCKKSSVPIKFKNKIEFSSNNSRQIRKLLEMAKSPLGLVIGRDNIILGLSDRKKEYECQIEISGKLSWAIIFDAFCIKYDNGTYYIPSNKTGRNVDMSLTQLSDEKKRKISFIIEEATKQTHGALLMFSSPKIISEEVKRLSGYNRGIEISPVNLFENNNYTQVLTSIDGALFIDFDCYCRGLGIILDGDSVTKGSLARGARYNSALNYVERQALLQKEFIAVIISEDKSIDIYKSESNPDS